MSDLRFTADLDDRAYGRALDRMEKKEKQARKESFKRARVGGAAVLGVLGALGKATIDYAKINDQVSASFMRIQGEANRAWSAVGRFGASAMESLGAEGGARWLSRHAQERMDMATSFWFGDETLTKRFNEEAKTRARKQKEATKDAMLETQLDLEEARGTGGASGIRAEISYRRRLKNLDKLRKEGSLEAGSYNNLRDMLDTTRDLEARGRLKYSGIGGGVGDALTRAAVVGGGPTLSDRDTRDAQRLNRQQLDEQRKQTDQLKKIADNTGKRAAAAFAP